MVVAALVLLTQSKLAPAQTADCFSFAWLMHKTPLQRKTPKILKGHSRQVGGLFFLNSMNIILHFRYRICSGLHPFFNHNGMRSDAFCKFISRGLPSVFLLCG